jgi:hypothetical protein
VKVPGKVLNIPGRRPFPQEKRVRVERSRPIIKFVLVDGRGLLRVCFR